MASTLVGTVSFIVGALMLALGIIAKKRHGHHYTDTEFVDLDSEDSVRIHPVQGKRDEGRHTIDVWMYPLVVERKQVEYCQCGQMRESWVEVARVERDSEFARELRDV